VWGRGVPYADKHSHSGASLKETTKEYCLKILKIQVQEVSNGNYFN